MSDKLVIKGARKTISLDSLGVEFEEDLMGLAIDLAVANSEVDPNTPIMKRGEIMANFFNTRWAKHLGDKSLTPYEALESLRQIMPVIQELKKNIADAAKSPTSAS